jgi:hypothetical protein
MTLGSLIIARLALAAIFLISAAIDAPAQHARSCHDGCANACTLHNHDHRIAWNNPIPVRDLKSFWGALGCTCWAFQRGRHS